MSDETKRLSRSLVDEIFNPHDVDSMDELIAEDFLGLGPRTAGFNVPPELDGIRHMMGMFFAAFPDIHSTKMVGYMTTTGAHTGDFIGIPATN